MSRLHRHLDENVAYPPHPKRWETPTYRKTHRHLVYELDAPCWICGVRHSQGGAMETHHYRFEWAAQFGLDLAKVEADFPALTDRAKLAEWVDSEGNMLVLCLPGSAPVLRPDGSSTPIAELTPGDHVLCPDGRSRPITAMARREHQGELVQIDGRWLTPEHPVLTLRGWLPAGVICEGDQVGEYFWVLNDQMLNLRPIKPQVLDTVVRSNVIDVMHSFKAVKGTPEVLLHDPAVLKDHSLLTVLSDTSPDVPLSGDLPSGKDPFWDAFAGDGLECCHSTVGSAEAGTAMTRRECDPTLRTLACRQLGMGRTTTFGRTGMRTGSVSTSQRRHDFERLFADQADAQDSTSVVGGGARWRPVGRLRRSMFSGLVHDISIAGYPAFVTDGLIVHNCAVHHRAQYEGIHSITYPAWLLQRYQGDFVFIEQHATPRAKIGLFAKPLANL